MPSLAYGVWVRIRVKARKARMIPRHKSHQGKGMVKVPFAHFGTANAPIHQIWELLRKEIAESKSITWRRGKKKKLWHPGDKKV
jgi:hypothetical protein